MNRYISPPPKLRCPKERSIFRKRFEEIVRFLHFNANNHADAKKFKTGKIKPMTYSINATVRFMMVGQKIEFAEGMIPLKSKYNLTRQCLRKRPHPWGTKCFVTCDKETGYRYSVLLSLLCDMSYAVLRNVEAMLNGLPTNQLSVLISSILLQRGLYHVDTVQTNRRGCCKTIPYKLAKRPKAMASNTKSKMIAVSGRDNRPTRQWMKFQHFNLSKNTTTEQTFTTNCDCKDIQSRLRRIHILLLNIGLTEFTGALAVEALTETPILCSPTPR
ncbi:Heat shock protein70 [Phytophthora megakarya]|uniref:Heat shock protein70 n=1 Tax=Phytophthora megakarya TaxID=4795 RepID=A0A225WLM6_9STRA|nr:Heat shock protein70 [Phytophthora megakarya]